MVWRVEYEPFGNVYDMRAGVRTDQPLRFPGQELAMTWEGPEENYNIHRWYKSGWGRYTQADPLDIPSGEPNVYAYASARPTGAVDPFGLATFNVGPNQIEIVSPDTLYKVFKSTAVNGATYWKTFDYKCTCIRMCSLEDGTIRYMPRISVNATIAIAIKKGGGPLNDIPFYPWATETDVYFEELKHATDMRARLWHLKHQADALEQIQFKSKEACGNSCDMFFVTMALYLSLSAEHVHKYQPHPKW